MCSNALEDPWEEAKEDMYTRSVSPEQAPDSPTYLDLEFEGGNPVAIDGQQLSPASLLTKLNKVGKPLSHGNQSCPCCKAEQLLASHTQTAAFPCLLLLSIINP